MVDICMPTVAEVASKLAISPTRVRSLIKENVLVASKVGARYVVDQTSLDAYINAQVILNIPPELPKNQRRIPENHKSKVYSMANNPYPVSLLADNGITKFWDQHTKNILDTLPGVTNAFVDIPRTLKSTFVPLADQHTADYSNIQLLIEPTMEYAIPKPQVKKGKIKPAYVAKKVRLVARKKIRGVWLEWMLLSNEVYNYTADFLLAREYMGENTLDKFGIQKAILSIFKEKIVKLCTPEEVCKYAVNDAIVAFGMRKYKNHSVKKRTMDNYSMSIAVRSRSVSNGYIWKNSTMKYFKTKYAVDTKFKADFKKMVIKNLPSIDKQVYCRLVYKTRLDAWYLDIPTEVRQTKNITEKVVAIDPGIRTFLTCYSSAGVFNIGENIEEELATFHNAADSINTRISACNNKKRRASLMRALCRVNKKIKNKIDNLHWHAIKMLSRFDTVILPTFGVRHLAKNLHNRTNRTMFALSHFNFKQRLAQKTSQYGNKIILCNEAYTSKTCGGCGVLNESLGANKHFACGSCNFEMSRDVNGARNIMARVLSYGCALLRS